MPRNREKCCVGGCNATKETHKLFCFPQNENLRKLWLSYVVPTNSLLIGVTQEQLRSSWRVCERHFERNQFSGITGGRLKFSCPRLFTEQEIALGEPLSARDSTSIPNEHNYAVDNNDEEDATDESMLVILKGSDENIHGHPSCSFHTQNVSATEPPCTYSAVTTTTTTVDKNCPELLTEVPKATIEPVSSKSKEPKSSSSIYRKPKSKAEIMRKKTDRCLQILKKTATEVIKKNKPYAERLADAREFSKSELFKDNFKKLNKNAQDFIIMQLRLVDKNKKGRRFTEDEKLMSLSFMKEGGYKGYKLLQTMFILPNKRTVNRITQKISFDVGVNDNLFEAIKNCAKKWDPIKKICSIVFDEVALTANLNFIESKDYIEGFKDFGFDREMKLADHALVFMITGVVKKWKQPISYYFCEGTTSAVTVKKILIEITEKVAAAGLTPIALVCDQGSTFRTALNMLKEESKRKRILTNEHDDGTIQIANINVNIVFDPPHLLKGLRNNLLNKDMLFKGKTATWKDIVTIYNVDCQLGHTKMHKNLTDEHIISSKIKKMKVKLAAQALSERTSAMLKYTSKFKTTAEGEEVSKTMATTGEAVEFIDKLFDSVNGSKKTTVKGKLRGPIRPDSEHLKFWADAKKILKDIKFIDSSSKKALKNKATYNIRVPSLNGWVTTLDSFERIAKFLFEKYNLEYFYPRQINQDPLENFFGRIRAANFRNINPDPYTFSNTFKSQLIKSITGPHSPYSSCEDDERTVMIDFLEFSTHSENNNEDDKENISPSSRHCQSQREPQPSSSGSISVEDVITERIRVHSSAYTAGYICRKITNKFNCKECKKTYLTNENENIHEWIAHREYKLLKNKNLAYPAKKFVFLYRDVTNVIHNTLNQCAHKKSLSKIIIAQIKKNNFSWLGCRIHNTKVIDFCIKLMLRLHVHNWCNVINKILKGKVDEKYVVKMNRPQLIALEKFKKSRKQNR